jgi:hypothetical protein
MGVGRRQKNIRVPKGLLGPLYIKGRLPKFAFTSAAQSTPTGEVTQRNREQALDTQWQSPRTDEKEIEIS